ncbi:FAD/NAD(P)-binding domain-containing protein [Periconia macrospinosa]|uniref:FAD/NAD(P)-binding domain-containing protein n=1 Tax=Periconia macrospinosa TaxID=97972 RepID=A0A2V1CZN3_9PLEO|nr:FAD/NAD(P)-binding domain-containing protein [Periconia macrospinosa]
MSKPLPTKFRVIIVGAGPVGLYLAHALSKANIDFVVLEQYDSMLRFQGAGVLLYPQTLRLLDQIGVYEKAEQSFIRNHTQTDLLTSNGRVIKSTPLWSRLAEQHAYPMAGLSRGQLIFFLHQSLPEKETRVKTGATVLDIETQEKGVKVHLTDGNVEEGSIIIGVDGVHSKTRQIMQRKLAQTPPDTSPMTATYQGLYGCFHSYSHFEPGTFYQSRGTGILSQLMVGEDSGHFAILRPIPPTAESKRYTKEDRNRLAEELASIMVGPNTRFQDIWEVTEKETAAMVDQEEGYCDKWYHERAVLAGDAVHKSTSATGLGVNSGINSAAVLANELYRTLLSDPNPTASALEDTFAQYQKIRTPETSRLHTIGRRQIRNTTWETWTGWLWDRFVNPWIGVDTVLSIIEKLIKRGQILEYVPFNDREVQVPWIHKPTSS